jgi:predicted enzyme related to lactoylglutathione lyase
VSGGGRGLIVRLGGVFYRSADPGATAAWYAEHLGLPVEPYGAATLGAPGHESVWSPFPEDTDYFGPSGQPFMINFATDDLDALVTRLRAGGVSVDDRVEETDYGRFAWAIDGDGRRIELWEPPSAD